MSGQSAKSKNYPDSKRQSNAHGIGRELFGGMRRNVLSAEEGAVTWL
jgi:phosphogluconate dehydratase